MVVGLNLNTELLKEQHHFMKGIAVAAMIALAAGNAACTTTGKRVGEPPWAACSARPSPDP